MGLFEGIKDVAGIIQKIDNIELYKKILDIEAQALDLQDELAKLKAENSELKEQKNISDKIERHSTLYLTLKDDHGKIPYWTHCWDNEHKLIQLDSSNGESFGCPHCKNWGDFNPSKSYKPLNQESYNYDPYKGL